MDKVNIIAENYAKDLHPFMLIATLEGLPHKYYLSVFDVTYSFESFSSAFDCLFKTYFVMNVDYPKSVESFFVFVQQFIYGIYLKNDKKISSVIQLIAQFDDKRLPSQQK